MQYQPHEPLWFLAAFGLLVLLAGGLLTLRQRGASRVPAWLPAAVAILAALQIVLAGAVRLYDDAQFRRELRAIPAAGIARVEIFQDGTRRLLEKRDEIQSLLLGLQAVRNIGPHHSSPMDPIEVAFQHGGATYRYRIARDSERAHEFWILEVARSQRGTDPREIGRVQSEVFGGVLERLLAGTGETGPGRSP